MLQSGSVTEREHWVKWWRHGISVLNSLIVLPFDVFWAKLIEDPKIILFLDSFLEEFPR